MSYTRTIKLYPTPEQPETITRGATLQAAITRLQTIDRIAPRDPATGLSTARIGSISLVIEGTETLTEEQVRSIKADEYAENVSRILDKIDNLTMEETRELLKAATEQFKKKGL